MSHNRIIKSLPSLLFMVYVLGLSWCFLTFDATIAVSAASFTTDGIDVSLCEPVVEDHIYDQRPAEFTSDANRDAIRTKDKISKLEGMDLYMYYADQICDIYYPDLDPAILKAVIECESSWQPTVESSCGAVGLTQVIPKYHAWRMEKCGGADIWDPYTNIFVGADFLNELRQSRGDYYHALLGYNNSASYARYVIALSEKFR